MPDVESLNQLLSKHKGRAVEESLSLSLSISRDAWVEGLEKLE